MEMTKAATSAHKMVADWAFLKWLTAAIVVAVDYVLPSSSVKEAAIGAGVLIVVDTATGTLCAWREGRVTSKRFSNVLVKFFGYAAVLTVAAIVSKNVPGMAQFAELGTTGVLTLVILTEGISILENVVKLGVKLPFGLTEVLKKRLGENADRHG